VNRTGVTNKSGNRTNVDMQYAELAERKSFDCGWTQGDWQKL